MLARVDRILAPLTWVLAAAVVLMLFVGPRIVADDKAKPATGEAAGAAPYSSGGGSTATAPDGRKVFTDRCGACHTLSAAGTSGAIGPKLDGAALSTATVAQIVRDGRPRMPSFAKDLSAAEIAAVAAFVSQASGG
jgi:sulfite dehydrogenase